jgi:regulator of sigma E protease
MTTLLAFLVTLGILIVVHEYGHFLAARWVGVKVLRFSVGFGKPLFARRFGRDGTEFVLAAFPLGGYVKMLDEREEPVAEAEQGRAFNRQKVWKRIFIVAAGPLANLLLAILIYWGLFLSGVPGMKPMLGDVPPDTPAARANMIQGEVITRVAGKSVQTWQDVRWALLRQALGKESTEVEAIRAGNETHLHRLDLGGLGPDDLEGDLLGKIGLNPAMPLILPRIGELVPGGAAEKAGLRVGDDIRMVNGVAIAEWDDFVQQVRASPGKKLELDVLREGREMRLKVIPDESREQDKAVGKIGAGPRVDQAELDKYMIEVRYGPGAALVRAAEKTWDTSVFSLNMLASMVSGDVSWKGISGPVTIASVAGETAHLGWKTFAGFLALVSISLGVLNLLPVPVLDGGHLMYYIVEILKGSPVSERAMEIGQKVGLALLGLLMTIALYNDFNRIITG